MMRTLRKQVAWLLAIFLLLPAVPTLAISSQPQKNLPAAVIEGVFPKVPGNIVASGATTDLLVETAAFCSGDYTVVLAAKGKESGALLAADAKTFTIQGSETLPMSLNVPQTDEPVVTQIYLFEASSLVPLMPKLQIAPGAAVEIPSLFDRYGVAVKTGTLVANQFVGLNGHAPSNVRELTVAFDTAGGQDVQQIIQPQRDYSDLLGQSGKFYLQEQNQLLYFLPTCAVAKFQGIALEPYQNPLTELQYFAADDSQPTTIPIALDHTILYDYQPVPSLDDINILFSYFTCVDAEGDGQYELILAEDSKNYLVSSADADLITLQSAEGALSLPLPQADAIFVDEDRNILSPSALKSDDLLCAVGTPGGKIWRAIVRKDATITGEVEVYDDTENSTVVTIGGQKYPFYNERLLLGKNEIYLTATGIFYIDIYGRIAAFRAEGISDIPFDAPLYVVNGRTMALGESNDEIYLLETLKNCEPQQQLIVSKDSQPDGLSTFFDAGSVFMAITSEDFVKQYLPVGIMAFSSGQPWFSFDPDFAGRHAETAREDAYYFGKVQESTAKTFALEVFSEVSKTPSTSNLQTFSFAGANVYQFTGTERNFRFSPEFWIDDDTYALVKSYNGKAIDIIFFSNSAL